MRGAECASRFVPQQGIVLKVANGIRQVGDVGGVGRHVIVGGFELGAINGVSAASSQVASGNIGDLAGSFGAVFGAECCAIPEQGIFFQGINVRVQSSELTQVAPPGVTAHVVDVAKMIRVYNNPKYAGERVMLLFTNPTDVERLVEGGVKITSVNVGGMAFRQGKTQVNNAVSVDEKDIEAFKKLNARGIELEVRKVSTDPKLKMMDLISKIDK